MKYWLARFSLGVIVTFIAIGCSFAPSSSPERISSTHHAATGHITGTSVAVGWGHTCELLSDETVQCWGDNGYGELGIGTYGGTHTAPVLVPGLTGVTAISGTYALTCAILSDQSVRCWGYGYGPTPVAISGVSGAVRISASGSSWSHACAVLNTGKVSCWGDNTWGQLGNGATQSSAGAGHGSTVAVPVSNVSGVVDVAAHAHGTCALLSNGTVQCWGANPLGELGTGTMTAPSICFAPYNWPCSLVPAPAVSGLNNAVAIAGGGNGDYVCALQSNGAVSCWGDNSLGQLGNGTTTASPIPVTVQGLSGAATAIAAGQDHSCALLPGGAVQCWGANISGQLGDGTTARWWGPVSVVGVSGAKAIGAGGGHSCALLADGSVMCWGQNTFGQIGDGTQVSSPVPQGPSPGVNPIQVVAGWGHSCLLLPSGTVMCWGDNAYGELGIGTFGGTFPIPSAVPGLGGVTAISGGYAWTCAILFDQTVKCWGYGYGPTPVTISGVSGAVRISAANASWGHACVVLNTGKVSCWGDNTWGQLGNGAIQLSAGAGQGSTVAVPVSNLSGTAVDVVAHGHGTCALLSNGTVQCWGANLSGELGTGTLNAPSICYAPYNWPCSDVPAPAVAGLSNVVAISASPNGDYVCALQSNGTVSCWGENEVGQLGNGTTTASAVPVTVQGLSGGATAIAAGQDHTCAVLSSGAVQCWGNNGSGQLGNNSTTNSSLPQTVTGLSGAMTVSCGASHSCALLTGTPSLVCWGGNTYGQLGNGTTVNSPAFGGVAGFFSDVFPAVYGIATDSKGATKAVFTYATGSTSVHIAYGQGSNALLDANNAFIASPLETPPQTFVHATHAPFVATMTGSALTWQIGSHSAKATTSSPQLPTVSNGDGTKDAVLPDGRKVNLDSTPPQDPTPSAEPPVGAADNGDLTGTLLITPSGAAVYTVPIAMAPSVAGMAPNLSLVYNSQAPDGIAGQGWSLQGLSFIHKCPRTQQQDGIARPVTMSGDPTPNSNNSTDGICLDGQRLFENGSHYLPEKKDFSGITYFPSDNHFEVQTKAGEIRYYGLTTHVSGHGLDAQNNPTPPATAIWALDRVNDPWGNYFSISYNQDVSQTGLRVTEIDYTGHMNASGTVDTQPYTSVKFTYESRPDVRWMRYAQSKFPMNQRLKTITTDRGTYTLNYGVDGSGVISELQSIHYCTGMTCLNDLNFGWNPSAAGWSAQKGMGFSLPSDIPTGHGLLGTQLIDLNGDGLVDLVYAGPDSSGNNTINRSWLNTGVGWPSTATGGVPCPLAWAFSPTTPAAPTGTRFADMDGDGILDFVADGRNNDSCKSASAGPQVWLNRFATPGGGWDGPRPEFSNIPSGSTFSAQNPVDFKNSTFCGQFGICTGSPATLVDINGDGKMDIVRIVQGTGNTSYPQIEVLLNQGIQQNSSNPAWVEVDEQVLSDVANLHLGPTLGDVNRDGFADLIREQYYPLTTNANTTNQLSVFQQIALSQVANGNAAPQFNATKPGNNCNLTNDGKCGGQGALQLFGPQTADLDGDGLYDEVLFGPLSADATCAPNGVCQLTNTATGYGVALNNGAGPFLNNATNSDAAPYFQELASMAQGGVNLEDFVYALEDINGDGLPDLIRNHGNCLICTGTAQNAGGGEILYNNGTTWGSGSDTWQRSAGNNNPVPGVVPSPITAGCGSAFVDLNGDGIVDFIQEEGNNGTTCNYSKVNRGAWINNVSPPVIGKFPNGRAPAPTTVSYVHISEPNAHTSATAPCDGVPFASSSTGSPNENVYCDDGPTNKMKKLMVPLLVAWQVSKADGSGNDSLGSMVNTTYAYHSLRADANGRGPLGFQRVIAYDQASGVKTDTTYAQAYPYTGMPTDVVRTQVTQNNAPLSETVTQYCDSTNVSTDGAPTCSPPGTTYQQKSTFVYPFDVVDTTYLNHDGSGNQLSTHSTFQYDDFGNSTQVVVTTQATIPSGSPSTSTVTMTTTNQYGAPSSVPEKLQGKVTDVKVTTSYTEFVSNHHTTFAYKTINTFGGASSTALALSLKEVEPGSGWPIQEDTVFSYDQFGNVILTTTCANDFGSCAPGANSPSSVTYDHPPFRTTTVSFDPAAFDKPSGTGLISSLTYGSGRFPVVTTTNTLSTFGAVIPHIEYSAYDPVKGVLLQKTDQNGIHTCYAYDDLGRPTGQTARCGSSSPIASTTAYYLPSGSSPVQPANTKFITVVRPASGATTWTFTDYNGRTAGTLARSFNGGFTETLTTYNSLGNVLTVTKPFSIQNVGDMRPTLYAITTAYDGFNRVGQVTEDLGFTVTADGSKTLVTTTTYNALSLKTTRTVNGSAQTRTETKNVLGKLQSVVDSLKGEIDYLYLPDGDLWIASSGGHNLVVNQYDTRDRKTQTTDTDLGKWNYVFDGFGDLVSQTDANNQQFQITYDQLGRMLTKQNVANVATGATAQWIYDTSVGAGIGKLAATVSEADANFKGPCALPNGATISGSNRAVKAYAYTGFGDVQSVAECSDGDTFQTSYEYDPIGRQSRIHYPAVNSNQLAVGYHYTSLGYLQYLSDDSSDYGVLWQAKAMNAFGQVTDEQARNGVETVQNRNPANGWLLGFSSTAQDNTTIQDWTYNFDEVGNLLLRARTDVADAPSSETFTYDALNRVTGAKITVGATSAPVYTGSSAYDYDGGGNLMHKDGHAYKYGTCRNTGQLAGSGLHQVCTIDGGTTFAYDAAGNLTSNGGRSVTYNAHNKAVKIASGSVTTQFMYGADDNRVVQVATSGSTTSRTVYVGLGGTGKSMYERMTTGSTVQHTHFIYAGGAHGGNAFAVRVVAGTTTTTRYLNFDHLGSTTAVSDEKGHIASATGMDTQLLGYDAWGARRNPDGQPATASSTFPPSVGNRDFTGQETIPAVGLINMNGRVYDPVLARFLSPDPNIQTPGDLQNYNRYSYALNNPLRYTDPTGYDFWDDVGSAFKSFFSDAGRVMQLAFTVVGCLATGGVGCAVIGAFFALENAGVSLAQGAAFDKTALNFGIGVGVGALTGLGGQMLGALIFPHAGAAVQGIWNLASGTAGAAAATAFSELAAGRIGSLGADVFASVAIGVAAGAASFGLQEVAKLVLRLTIGASVPRDPLVTEQGKLTVRGTDYDSYMEASSVALDRIKPLFQELDPNFDPSSDKFVFGPTQSGTAEYAGDGVTIINERYWDGLSGEERLEVMTHEITHHLQSEQLGGDAAFFARHSPYEEYHLTDALSNTRLRSLDIVDQNYTLEQLANRTALEVNRIYDPGHPWGAAWFCSSDPSGKCMP